MAARPARERLRTGLGYGFWMGVIFSILASLNALASGGDVQLRSGGSVGLLSVLISYLVMGPLTGAVFGLAFPLMRTKTLAYLLGVVVSLPMALSIAAGFGQLGTGVGMFATAMTALLLGGLGGIIVRELSL